MENSKKQNQRLKKGFTIIEVMVAMFIFVTISAASSTIFVSFVNAQKHAKSLQSNLENAQYIMAIMAKTLRTSSVADLALPASGNVRLRVYDYSQNECIQYRFNAAHNRLESENVSPSPPPTDPGDCSALFTDSYNKIVDLYIDNMTISAIESDDSPEMVGRVTVSVGVCSTDGCSGAGNQKANLQTTVSLRDYSVSGLTR